MKKKNVPRISRGEVFKIKYVNFFFLNPEEPAWYVPCSLKIQVCGPIDNDGLVELWFVGAYEQDEPFWAKVSVNDDYLYFKIEDWCGSHVILFDESSEDFIQEFYSRKNKEGSNGEKS